MLLVVLITGQSGSILNLVFDVSIQPVNLLDTTDVQKATSAPAITTAVTILAKHSISKAHFVFAHNRDMSTDFCNFWLMYTSRNLQNAC